MSRFYSYLNTAGTILSLYKGDEPFAVFLKKYFAANKKYGSKDRKQIAHLCYCYFRLGKAAADMPREERILAGLFLCSVTPNELLQQLRPQWNAHVSKTISEKRSLLPLSLHIEDIFPWKEELSSGIDHQLLCESLFIQPDLFLRLRPGNAKVVQAKLEAEKIAFEQISESCISLPNTSSIDGMIELNREAVIQDYSSQRVAGLLQPEHLHLQSKISVWDCCAASGGKSILAKDILGDIDLTVSDIRESSIVNLKKRFREAGIKNYQSVVADLTDEKSLRRLVRDNRFSLIICDAPCSGSGTWGRTPEQLYFFDPVAIGQYSRLQQKIIAAVIPYLQPGGCLLYITCSVFKEENEKQVAYMQQEYGLTMIKQELLTGYDKKADTLFATLLKNDQSFTN